MFHLAVLGECATCLISTLANYLWNLATVMLLKFMRHLRREIEKDIPTRDTPSVFFAGTADVGSKSALGGFRENSTSIMSLEHCACISGSIGATEVGSKFLISPRSSCRDCTARESIRDENGIHEKIPSLGAFILKTLTLTAISKSRATLASGAR